MIVEELFLKNIRCYDNLKINFSDGINFLYGPNASGKTSLVEAIYFLSLARSFKTFKDKDLINRKFNEGLISAKISYSDIKKNIEIRLLQDGKKIFINNKQIHKISELSKIVNAIYFIPKNVLLLKDPPSSRRLFLNIAISKFSTTYLDLYINYEKLLHSRNDVLKDEKPNLDLLDVITKQMISISKKIYLFRKKYFEDLNLSIKNIYKKITDKSDDINIIYDTFIDNYENYEEIALKKYASVQEYDLLKKVTSIGVHKEDFKILLNSKDVSKFGSQGENRICVLALKLSLYELIKEDNNKPIVILDDVLSELDSENQKRLINYLITLKQVFITSTYKIDRPNIKYYEIINSTIKEGENV